MVQEAPKEDVVALKLFVPCFLDQSAPQTAWAVAALLEGCGIPWEYPQDQTCCGQFAWTVGDLATSRRLMRHFLRVFAGSETILCPSASCTLMVREHYPRLARDLREQQEIAALASRVWELSAWLAQQGPLPWTPRYHGTLVLHHSCKARQLGVLPDAARLLHQVEGLKVVQVSPYYTCCGFGGTFRLQHPDLARAMGEAYLAAVQDTGAEGLVSLDYSCLLHLRHLAANRGWTLKFWHLAEILTP
jgi:L-lactate dehydrogenase complex protein LldE